MYVSRIVRRAASVTAHAVTRIPAVPAVRCSWIPVHDITVRAFAQQAGAEGVSTEPPADETVGAEAEAGSTAAGAGADASFLALQKENEQLKKTVQEINTSRLRMLADMENVRTIAKRDVEMAKAYALQSFGKRLLDVVDNLSRAVESVPDDARSKEASPVLSNLYEGVSATHRSMMKTLSEFGITPFGEKGEKFDPNKHEAMMQVPASDETKVDHVALVLKTGFTLKDRVLRPAQVAVAISQ